MDSDPSEDHSYLHSSEEFFSDSSKEFPFFDPPFIEEMHALTGTTHAENMRHIIARIELLNCLSEDPYVIARIKTWGNDIGLIQAAEELASVLDSIAQCCGLAHRADIFYPEQDPEAMTTRDEVRDEELSQQVSQALERYQEAMHRSSPAIEAAITYVRDELHLPWPWLAYELHLKLLMDTYQYFIGIEMPMSYRLDPDDPPAAPFSWTFETRPGETLSAAQRRFTEEANVALTQLQALPDDAAHAPLGRIRRDLEDTVRRNTQWFYQHRISKVPQRQLARTYHDERAGDHDHNPTFEYCSCRTNVRIGIKEAERVLGLTPFHF
jgi:hypothetical protein